MKMFNIIEDFLNIIFDDLYVDLIENEKYSKYIEREIEYVDPIKIKRFYTSIGDFFSFEIRNTKDVLLIEKSYNSSYYAPSNLIDQKILPFATDPGGYFFCFDYRNSNIDPSIVLWIRDNPEGYDITKVADSFDEFINNLKSEDEIELDQ